MCVFDDLNVFIFIVFDFEDFDGVVAVERAGEVFVFELDEVEEAAQVVLDCDFWGECLFVVDYQVRARVRRGQATVG